jgi:hypothetical protein
LGVTMNRSDGDEAGAILKAGGLLDRAASTTSLLEPGWDLLIVEPACPPASSFVSFTYLTPQERKIRLMTTSGENENNSA